MMMFAKRKGFPIEMWGLCDYDNGEMRELVLSHPQRRVFGVIE